MPLNVPYPIYATERLRIASWALMRGTVLTVQSVPDRSTFQAGKKKILVSDPEFEDDSFGISGAEDEPEPVQKSKRPVKQDDSSPETEDDDDDEGKCHCSCTNKFQTSLLKTRILLLQEEPDFANDPKIQ